MRSLAKATFLVSFAATVTVAQRGLAESTLGSPAAREDFAQSQTEAKSQYDQGVSAYRAGRFEAAIAAFSAAERLLPRPANAYNIALAYERLSDTQRALDHYRRYLEQEPRAANAESVRTRIAALEASTTDRESRATASSPARVEQRPAQDAATDSERPLPANTSNASVLTPLAGGSASDPRETRPRAGTSPTVMILGGTLTLIGIGAGIAFEVAAQNEEDKLRQYRDQLGASGCAGAVPPPECEEVKDAAHRYDLDRTLSLVGFATASAAAVGTFVYWLVSDTPASSQGSRSPGNVASLRLQGAPLPGGGALLGLRGTY